MKLRIVTPTLMRSPWLGEAMQSAGTAAQELVVVAPGSQREELAARFPVARCIPESGGGLYSALNAGFRAVGDWTAGTWLNDDDRLVADGFRAAVACLESRPDLAGVYGRVRLIDGDGRYLAEIPVARSGDDLGPLLAAGVIPLAQPGTIFRRDLFAQLGGLDESLRLAGDMEFFQRAWAAGLRFGYVDAVVAEFRVHGGQLSKQAVVRRQETEAVFAAARRTAGWQRRARAARWRFRWQNLGVYAERVRRHGWVSMEHLHAHE